MSLIVVGGGGKKKLHAILSTQLSPARLLWCCVGSMWLIFIVVAFTLWKPHVSLAISQTEPHFEFWHINIKDKKNEQQRPKQSSVPTRNLIEWESERQICSSLSLSIAYTHTAIRKQCTEENRFDFVSDGCVRLSWFEWIWILSEWSINQAAAIQYRIYRMDDKKNARNQKKEEKNMKTHGIENRIFING